MNDEKSKKYGISLNDVEKNHYLVNGLKHYSILKEQNDQKQIFDRLNRYDQKKYAAKKRKLCENLNIGEKVFVLAERINKKSAPSKFYKQTVKKISYFNQKKKQKLYLQ